MTSRQLPWSSERLFRRARNAPPRQLLGALGIDYEDQGHKLHALCPSPSHDDRNASWDYGSDKSVQWKPGHIGQLTFGHHCCLSCGFHGDAIDLVATVRGISLGDAARWLALEFEPAEVALSQDDAWRIDRLEGMGREGTDLDWSRLVPILSDPRGRHWCGKRAAIPDWQARRHFLLWDPSEVCVVIPTRDRRGRIVDLAWRPPGRKSLSAKGGDHRTPFGASLLDVGIPGVVLVEGEFDAMALERAGYVGAVLALRTNRVYPEVDEAIGECPLVVVLPDMDDGGERLWQQARQDLRYTPSGEARRVVRAVLPCDGCDYARGCDGDPDACEEPEWLVDAIEGRVKGVKSAIFTGEVDRVDG